MILSIEKLAEIMTTPQIITKSARSEGAKKMWERRKEKKRENMTTATVETAFKPWIYHVQWFTLMGTVITCFMFCFKECKHTSDKLDQHIQFAVEMNKEQTTRSDRLYEMFIDLLKEKK